MGKVDKNTGKRIECANWGHHPCIPQGAGSGQKHSKSVEDSLNEVSSTVEESPPYTGLAQTDDNVQGNKSTITQHVVLATMETTSPLSAHDQTQSKWGDGTSPDLEEAVIVDHLIQTPRCHCIQIVNPKGFPLP